MRSVSTAQEDVLNGPKYDVHVRLEVETSSGAFQDIDSLGTGSWFESARWSWDLDQPVPELLMSVRRDHGTSTEESLAPLDEESALNRVPGSTTYTALLDPGREVKLYTAALAPGSAAPATSAMDWVFHGEIDDVNWAQSPLTFSARGKLMSQLQDRWIESTGVYPTSSGLITTVIADIIDTWTDLSTSNVLSTDPGFSMNDWEQEKSRVLDAVTTITQLIGFDLRERFDEASSAWALVFEEPNRAATSSDSAWTFGANQYFSVSQMGISRDDVRNVVSVDYESATSGGPPIRIKVEEESTASAERFGRRWMEIQEASGSAISSSSEADTLALAALNDLKDPIATHAIEVPYWWPGELQDYYEFEPNGIHYSTNQYFGVYGIGHELSRSRHRTRIRVRGQPAGQYLRWQNYTGHGNQQVADVVGVEVAFNSDGEAVVSASGNDATAAMYVTVGDGTDPSDPSTSSSVISGKTGTVDTATKITTGNFAHVRVGAVDGAGNFGVVHEAQHQRIIGPFHTSSGGSHTGDTSETDLDTITVPAGALGTDGSTHIEFMGSATGTNDTKTISVYLAGQIVMSVALAAGFNGQRFHCFVRLWNDGAVDSQNVAATLIAEDGTIDITGTSATVSTATATDVDIRAQLANGSDTLSVDWVEAVLAGTV